ncbi:putative phosphoglucomutase [Atractiella rhizophila]|nr:putative phosphoglucomutase [Atractiella rhizophila]
MSLKVNEVKTTTYTDQKPGTSGLRKRVKHFQQPHYTANFLQSILLSLTPTKSSSPPSLVLGGDGRYYSPEVVQLTISLLTGYLLSSEAPKPQIVEELIIGQNAIFSTPAVSHMIRSKEGCVGGILLTASHNPGGPENDFGIKFNGANGGPASETVTDGIYEKSKTLEKYWLAEVPQVDLSKIGSTQVGPLKVTVIDSVTPYVDFLKTIFSFPLISEYVKSSPVLFDGLHGVTGPYGKAIFVKEFGLDESKVTQNCTPSPNFGGGHPDPNLTYAHSLVETVEKNKIPFGAASDGDGDRNMIYGADGAFVTPSDSVAIIADWADAIPYFSKEKGGVKGVARSMPTSGAIDLVAKAKGLEFFEVPTGWKFFGNLMDAGRLSICGEESFGTGSDHIREKDGIWAVMAWLSILAVAEKKGIKGIKGVLLDHYKKYGRTFFSRYDYEEVSSESANKMIEHFSSTILDKSFIGKELKATTSSTTFKVSHADNFSYKDPIDGSLSKNQGLFVKFEDGSRIVFRLSGTGSSGATIRLYVEKYSKDEKEYERDTQEGLKPLIEVALSLSKLEEFTGRKEPTVIT